MESLNSGTKGMTLVRLRERAQITLPQEVWDALKVKQGDYLTIYRPLGTGNITRVDAEEMGRNRATGFQSDRFRGGGIGLQANRAKDETAFVDAHGRYRYRPITSREVKRHRPLMPRKIVGEMVIIDVQTRTATAIITRVAAEVHTGDWVEIQ